MAEFDAANFQEFFWRAWEAVRIVRHVSYGLFTFGESSLPYFLVLEPVEKGDRVTLLRGTVKVTRPLILTPDNAPPELSEFFENADENQMVRQFLARTASFRHLRMSNQKGAKSYASDSVEEVVDRINFDLDKDEEDRVAVIIAPEPLAGLGVLRYSVERIMSSAAENMQELRERGFLR